MRSLLVILAGVLLLAGCASSGPIDPPAAQRPQDLVQLWRVDAPGELDATWLSLGEQLVVWDSCGVATGSWRATGSLFVAGMTGALQPWCRDDRTLPSWLENAARWWLSSPGHVQLLSADGAGLAELTIDGAPPALSNAPSLNAPPILTERMTAAFRDPAPLPAGATAVEDLGGRWIPRDAGDGAGFVDFSSGSWTGSDGCNTAGGRWRLGEDGLFLSTSAPMTAMGCEHMSAAPTWVTNAVRVALVGTELTMYDADGEELGSFTRS